MTSALDPRVWLTALLLTASCQRVSSDIIEPAPASAPAPVIAEDPQLDCRGPYLAIVGDHGIPVEDFYALFDLKQLKYSDRGREMPETAKRRYFMSIGDRLIYLELLTQEAAKRHVEPDAAAIEARDVGQRRGIEDWDNHLRRRGESDASLHALNVAEAIERALLEASGALEITDEELLAEYEKLAPDFDPTKAHIHASHILIDVAKFPSKAEALARAEELSRLAKQPDADFAALALEHSQGPSARKGGDLGIFAADRMADEFSKVAFALKPGEVSGPVETSFGFHVIKVHGAWGPGLIPFEALEPLLRERLGGRKLHEGRRALKERLFADSEIQNCLPGIMAEQGMVWQERPKRGESDAAVIRIDAEPSDD